ncbi:MAG: PQQ-binding-like beta-propeller repeat protein [Haloferacaceae archaeon]
MSDPTGGGRDPAIDRSVPLGAVDPARSRHAGRRSAVALTPDLAIVGTADGDLVGVDRAAAGRRWTVAAGTGSVVAAIPFGDGVAVGERGPAGEVRLHDAATGAVRWRHAAAAEVGDPAREGRFQLPYVAALATDGDRLYAAARRYERDDGERTFESAVYAFGPDGEQVWTRRADASPIALDADGDRVAVAYNRCPGTHDAGLVVHDAATGAVRWRWDPDAGGERRVGDVALVGDGAVVASHGDYRGYRLGTGGRERWRVDLATPTTVGDETLYAYPNHVHATDGGAAFVTGNTYPEEGRETDGLHPDEHTVFCYAPDGTRRWSAPVDGFAGGVGADRDRVAVPGAQHFRRRDPAGHGVRVVDVREGPVGSVGTAGVVTAVAVDRADGPAATVAAVEEPVVYHDEGRERGTYRLHLVDGLDG